MSDRDPWRSAPCFFVEADASGAPALAPQERAHAKVLRVARDDRIVGLDGRGTRWLLRVRDASAQRFDLEIEQGPRSEPAPGEADARLPWIEVCAPLPRAARAEEMLDRLVQLGAASLRPLIAHRSQAGRGDLTESRRARLERVVREACKQSRRAWSAAIEPETAFDAVLALGDRASAIVLDPLAERGLGEVLAAMPDARALRLIVGPEGGFSDDETHRAKNSPIECARLGPHVLRIETAAEAALAIAVDQRTRASGG